ncbi:ABC transporter permease [Martelella endophytica]|uniref:Multidrug ABC transporter substrate-binding protein n=1 Tax=Martelella endophytica TaxID=1486262 RepID=A0A0D5LT15_MAREN|nr:ABC transporter permease [Martelella endophytica]AJY46892.1 multidrug ABC transporter substrate-binding protein [Martelella endophytica]
MFPEMLKLALRAVRRNLFRSFLTVLGIIIGVSAVISMVTIGSGTAAEVRSEIARLGNDVLFVRPGQRAPGAPTEAAKGFTDRDISALRNQIPGLAAVAPQNTSTTTVVAEGNNRRTTIIGTNDDFLAAQDWTVASGGDFTGGSNGDNDTTCILGATVSATLFGDSDPVGKNIRVGNVSCAVIGLLARKGDSGMGRDQDDIVLMPIATFQRRVGGDNYIESILLSARDGLTTDEVRPQVAALLRERRNIEPGRADDFEVNDMTEIANAMAGTKGVLTSMLGAVAAVSLLVGGIGIMNIMLVSVTERTREIGLRLTVGALERQVLAQFLVEAVVLALIGGLAGIVLGLAVAYAAVQYLALPFVIDYTAIGAAFGFSALIGVVFGYFPARRAARLNPIDALRYE